MANSGGNRGGPGAHQSGPPSLFEQLLQDLLETRKAADDAGDAASKVSFKNTEKEFEKLGRAAFSLLNAMQGVQTVFQGLSAVSQVAHLALDGFSTAVQAVAGQIGGLVRMANPGVLDRFEKSFSAFQAQLGETFAPLLQGLGQLVQSVANALAGLTPQGRGFILFIAGAAAGLGAAVTVGGIFLTVLGAVAGAMVAAAAAGEALGVALDFASLGAGAIGQIIGGVIGAVGSAGLIGGSAAAGGLTALAVSGGTLEKFQEAIGPFLETLVGAFNEAGATVLPQLSEALQSVTPSLNELFVVLAQYLPPLADVLATFAVEIIPEAVKMAVLLARELLPVAGIMAELAKETIRTTAVLMSLVTALGELSAAGSPLIQLLRATGRAPVQRAPGGQAPAPVTGASYTGIEDLFRKSQEAAVRGKAGGQDPFDKTMNSQPVQNAWGLAFAKAITGSYPQMAAAIAQAIYSGANRTQ